MKALSIDNDIEKLSKTISKEIELRKKEIETLHSKSLDFIECGYLNFLIDQMVSDIHQNYHESKQIMTKINSFRRELIGTYIICQSLIAANQDNVQVVKHLKAHQKQLIAWNRMHNNFQKKHSLLKLLKDQRLYEINKMRIHM